MEPCDFLDRLPLEIRFRIYEFSLTYSSPIKIRYIMPGSKDLPILRLNRQIYDEALPVLYERNRIVIRYSHFCKIAPPDIKSPINPKWIRHLLIDGIGRSLICGSRDYLRCNVCSWIDADELSKNLKMFPRLRTVVFNYHGYKPEMDRFREKLEQIEDFELLDLDSPFAYRLQGAKLGQVSVQFRWGLSEWVDHAVKDQIDWIHGL
jgi:hypothetical protein